MISLEWRAVETTHHGVVGLEGRVGFLANRVEKCRVVLEVPAFDTMQGQGGDLFEALVQLRLALEVQDTFLKLNGSRLDVYPSGMQRDMILGLNAYVMPMPRRTTKYEVVNIFDPAPRGTTIATVAEQREFRDQWARSPLMEDTSDG